MYDTLALGISWRIGHLNFFEMFRFCIFFLYLKMYIFKYILHTQWYNSNNSTCTQIHIMTTCMFSYLMHIGQNISVFEVRLEHTCIRMNWELLTVSYGLSKAQKCQKSTYSKASMYTETVYLLYIKIGLVLSCCNYYTIIYIYVESCASKLSIAHQLSWREKKTD
jgi:hypothetical protein